MASSTASFGAVAVAHVPPPNKGKSAKSKRSLQDPERLEMIKTHRGLQATVGGMQQLRLSVNGNKIGKKPKEREPKFLEKVPKYLKPIKLRQMDPDQEWVFMKRVLYLTLIEDPMLGFTPIHQIAEDENGDSTMVFIHEVPHNEKMCDLLCYGQQIAIINPYMRIALDGRHGIRVDDPATIVILGKKKDMCRYCGKPDAPHKCGRCKKPYCSRDCQVSDWHNLDHKRICKKQE